MSHPNLLADVAESLEKAWCWYADFMLSRRLNMAREQNQDLSRIVVDGNLKLAGRTCSRPVAEYAHSAELGLFTATPCSRQPAFKRRRCALHCAGQLGVEHGPLGEEVAVAHRRKGVLLTEALKESYEVLLKPVDLVLAGAAASVAGRWIAAEKATFRQLWDYWKSKGDEGFISAKSSGSELNLVDCKTHKENTKDYKRLIKQGRFGGLLIAVTDKGFIVHAETFVGAESIPQRYFFVAKVAAKLPELRAVIHDDACHLRRFSEKHAWRSELGHRLSDLHWVLDRMHAKTHKDPWCLSHCHPDVNETIMAGFNSSAAESCNSTIGRHRFATRHMRPFVRSFFLLEVIETRNAICASR